MKLINHDIKKYKEIINNFFYDYKYFHYIATIVLLGEFILGVAIIQLVPYTEIDWIAYMQEVRGFHNGEYDYIKLKGDTGPLVYPAGFVYIFSFLNKITNDGENILFAQYLYLVLYLATHATMLGIFYRTRTCPPWCAFLLCVSKRLHSIYMLRLFNDCVAMFFLYAAVYLFLRQRWTTGSLFYSLAVSVKMNILLFAPALLLLMLKSSGIVRTMFYLSICASVQLLLAIPFLMTNWVNYISKAFEFSRVFFYKWTVNWKLLPEEIFLSKALAIGLLSCHLIVLFAFLLKLYRPHGGLFKAIWNTSNNVHPIQTDLIATSLFVSNFIGICFARTLHYQFYSWYFHTIPYLLWQTKASTIHRIIILAGIEYGFNKYPATRESSLVLQVSHILLLVYLYFSPRRNDNGGALSGDVRTAMINYLNQEKKTSLVNMSIHYGKIPLSGAIGAHVVDVTSTEIHICLPQTQKTIAIGFGKYTPLTSMASAQAALDEICQEVENKGISIKNIKDVAPPSKKKNSGSESNASNLLPPHRSKSNETKKKK